MNYKPTVEEVKNLRGMTGACMIDCKKALINSKGDIDKAVAFMKNEKLARPMR